jgi:hypothetical protein
VVATVKSSVLKTNDNNPNIIYMLASYFHAACISCMPDWHAHAWCPAWCPVGHQCHQRQKLAASVCCS